VAINPRHLTAEEYTKLRRVMPEVGTKEWYELLESAWNDVDKNAICLDCGRKFKNLHGLRVHAGRSMCRTHILGLHDYFLAKRLGVIKE